MKRELLSDGTSVGETEHVNLVQTYFIEYRNGQFGELRNRQGQNRWRTLTDPGRVEADEGSITQREHERVPTLERAGESVE